MRSFDNTSARLDRPAFIIQRGYHHARYLRRDVPVHIISRITQGYCLLVPMRALNQIVIGATAKALENFPTVKLYGLAVMSNHLHAMASGDADELAAFIGFIKREISRRWGPRVDWEGRMWDEYIATALPTDESQVKCLKYILSQGPKENLVDRPEQWPGVHCAKSLLRGDPLQGIWLDATKYGRARIREGAKKRPKEVNKADYERVMPLSFSPIPAWEHYTPEKYRQEVKRLVDEVVAEGRLTRGNKRPLGVKKILKTPTRTRRRLSRPPWFEDRKRMIHWACPKALETKAYLDDYWAFQRAFRLASDAFMLGDLASVFPQEAFRPTYPARSPPRRLERGG